LPFAAAGNAEETNTKGGAETTTRAGAAAIEIVIADDFVWRGFPSSLRVMPKEKFPLAVGVPEIMPLDGTRDSPPGNAPDATFHV